MLPSRNTGKRTRKPGQPGGQPPTSLGGAGTGRTPRPSRSRLSRPAAPPGSRGRSIHSAPGTAAAPSPCGGREASSGAERPAPGHHPRPESRPRRRFPPRGGNRSRRGPHRSRAGARSPQSRPLPGSRQASPGRGLPARASRLSGAQRRPEVSPAPPPQRPTSSPPRPDPSLRDASERPLGGCRGKRPGAPEDESRARGPKPARAVTLMILRGSPAILSEPEFGLCSCLRLRSPHARVEVPGSTSGERRRARPPLPPPRPLGKCSPS